MRSTAAAAGLEHLRGHVHGDVRAGLEHRADHADRHPPLEHPLPRRQRAHRALQRRLRGGGEHVELVGHVGQPLRGEPEPVEQAGGHAVPLGGGDVGGVGREQLAGALAQQVGGGAQGGVDGRAPGRPYPGRGSGGADRGRADGLVIGGHLGAHPQQVRRHAGGWSLPPLCTVRRPFTSAAPATSEPSLAQATRASSASSAVAKVAMPQSVAAITRCSPTAAA